MEVSNIYYLHEIGSKKNQEDYIWPVPGTASPEDRIFIVCDGVGGSEKGEVASRIVAESVGNALLKLPGTSVNLALVNQLLNDAQLKLIEYAKTQGLSSDMATTFCLMLFTNKKVFISWCGDSRVYQLRKGEILFKTDDHSLVHTLVKSGEITEEEAKVHPQKNMILKAIRADDTHPEADGHWIEDITDGDYFLACTDGLLENVSERDLKFLLEQNDKGIIDLVPSFQQFCLDKTKDNYSMYLVRVKTNRQQQVRRRRVAFLLLLLLVLIAGTGLVCYQENYFNVRQLLQGGPPPVAPSTPPALPVNVIKDSAAHSKPDTVVFHDHQGMDARDTAGTVRKDSAGKALVLKKDSPAVKKILVVKHAIKKDTASKSNNDSSSNRSGL
jgi:PPM family protein phosphatase